ncbi:MAG TPA: DUF3891 family protein [Acidimicrobiales bacterium]|nr:DUF3891 family protein [Acidimicrobiales bacterium]
MILSRLGGELLVVMQPDHGTHSGVIATAWGNERMPGPELPAAVHLAATHHDDGWAAWERHPGIDDATGVPVQFVDLTPLEHVPLYQYGIARAAQIDPMAGLLVSMHGAGLYNDRYGTFRLAEQHFDDAERALVEEFLADQMALQRRLATAAAPIVGATLHDPPHEDPLVWRQYLLLQAWDRLSLQFAYRLAADGEIAPVPAAGGDAALRCIATGRFSMRLDPYPMSESAVVLPLVARRVPDRRYRAPEEFLSALGAAATEVIECRVHA